MNNLWGGIYLKNIQKSFWNKIPKNILIMIGIHLIINIYKNYK